MSEHSETLLISVPIAVAAGGAGAVLGAMALKKPTKIPLLGSVSPAVLGTGIVSVMGFGGYAAMKTMDKGSGRYGTPAKIALFAGVAALGAFAAAVISSKYTASKTGAESYASFTESAEGFDTGTVPSPRVLEESYSQFTGPPRPSLSPSYYVTVLD